MQDIDIHFRKTGDNEYWLIYNQESFVIKTYNDGNFHNKLYECEKEIPKELEWFIDTVIRKELEMEWWYINKVRERILKEVSEAKYQDYEKHRDLISFCVCDGYFGYNADTDEEEESDFDEIIVVVEKDWLFDLIKRTEDFRTDDEVLKFLQEEYTSNDSSIWYCDALRERKVIMVDFV